MNEEESIIPISKYLENDNLAFNKDYIKPTEAKLIIVKPFVPEIDDNDTSLATAINTNNDHSLKNINLPERRYSSSDSIENVDITPTNYRTNTSPKPPCINEPSIQNKPIEKNVKKNENVSKAKVESLFGADVSVEELIMNPSNDRGLIDFRTNLLQFLLTPPPQNVLVKCQLNKTNKIDKTLLFTNFIFSLQMYESDSNSRRICEPLLFGIPIKGSKLSYYISTDPSEIHPSSTSVVGQITTNFFGTRFNIYSKNLSLESCISENSNESLNVENYFSTDLKGNRNHIGVIFYKNSKFTSRKPRKINVLIPKWNNESGKYQSETHLPTERNDAIQLETDDVIKLENISPIYDENQKLYVLNFGGRATEVSIKNFALEMQGEDSMKRVLHFGKCKDHYIVDFTYPICAFQAFAIGLTCCQRKIASD